MTSLQIDPDQMDVVDIPPEMTSRLIWSALRLLFHDEAAAERAGHEGCAEQQALRDVLEELVEMFQKDRTKAMN